MRRGVYTLSVVVFLLNHWVGIITSTATLTGPQFLTLDIYAETIALIFIACIVLSENAHRRVVTGEETR